MANFDPIILFFVLGALASWIKSDLQMPDQISKALSIFLLLSLGLKGGHEVRVAEDLASFVPALSLGLISCFALPVLLFSILRSKISVANAAALAASYGSVSAVTFITAESVIVNSGIQYSGYMVAVMALMEIPAILIAIYLHQKSTAGLENNTQVWFNIFSMKSVVLLIGGFFIGLVMDDKSWLGLSPVVQGGFKGVLAFFLLDLGFLAQKQLNLVWSRPWLSSFVAIVCPLIFGSAALVGGHLLQLPIGDQILSAVLAGSASYIAAPAAIRSALPQASPSLYLALPLALTFPLNLLFGIPFYIQLSSLLS